MIDKLIDEIKKKKAPLVVGLDPQLSFIPDPICEKAFEELGETLEGAAEAIWQFNKAIVDAVCDLTPAVKPQIAMYEQFGIPGLTVFERTVRYCQEKGLCVIGDIKRGDIGSTSLSYAVGHLGTTQVGKNRFSAFHEDFATVNPYLGSDGIEPFVKVCREENKGLFVLVKTSNPSSGEFQDRTVSDGNGQAGETGSTEKIYEAVAKKVVDWGSQAIGEKYGYSQIGAVVGATYPEEGKRLRTLMPKTYILVPGYGAQGGKGADLKHFFDEDGLGAIVNSSRGIIAAWKNEKYERFGPEGFAEAARAAVIDMREDINGSI
ncbi:MAG: orotidine-5'-phosphate decarboxylase [Lachnospiraceae bacterium]|nr:orotidine-5'-phosphate decarboxylase [Lachnospiraceae bacterium]